MEVDSDEEALLRSPRFLKKIMDKKFPKLYAEELEKKKKERIRRKEIKREQEMRRMQEEKLSRERYLKHIQEGRDAEMFLLGNILKYILLTCFLVISPYS